MDEAVIRELLARLDPPARDRIRRLLIADFVERDRLTEAPLRQRTERTDDLADLIDMLTLDAKARRQVGRLLGELAAST
jgi:hypothetical protein